MNTMSDKTRHFVDRLIQLREAQDVLTEQEYMTGRAGILDELATFVYVPLWVNGMFLSLSVAGVALIVLAPWPMGILAGMFLLLSSLSFVWGINRGHAARRRWTHSERHDILADLIDNNLVSSTEADALRQRIDRLFQDRL